MNVRQERAIERLQRGLEARFKTSKELPKDVESDGHVITVVEGVSVTIGPGGGFNIPAVRTYANGSDKYADTFEAVVNADKCWKKQKERLRNREFDLEKGKGHSKPIVDAAWGCGSADCPCRSEEPPQRRRRSGIIATA
jgi:hypothetical protein